jgi:hypothetical protein
LNTCVCNIRHNIHQNILHSINTVIHVLNCWYTGDTVSKDSKQIVIETLQRNLQAKLEKEFHLVDDMSVNHAESEMYSLILNIYNGEQGKPAISIFTCKWRDTFQKICNWYRFQDLKTKYSLSCIFNISFLTHCAIISERGFLSL